MAKPDQGARAELAVISCMLDKAMPFGLITEVIWSFGQARASGHDVGQAAAFALAEWDL